MRHIIKAKVFFQSPETQRPTIRPSSEDFLTTKVVNNRKCELSKQPMIQKQRLIQSFKPR